MKLLDRTVRNYVIFSALLLVVCTPLFYFSIERLFVHKMDQELLSHKEEFHEILPLLKTEADLRFFSLMNDEFLLKEVDHKIENDDSLFTISIFNDEEKEMQPYRILRTSVVIQNKPYALQIQESMVNSTDLVFAIAAIQATLITLLLIGLILINRKLSRTIWNPFYTILDKLKKYQIDKDPSIDLPQSSTAEFRDLSSAISQLVKRSHEVFQSQKEFTENASHELQTPLAISRSKLELLAQTRELTQEQAELVESLLDAMDRITRLNKDLLLLSKIENRQFFDVETIKLKTIVAKCKEAYSRQAQEKEITVKSSFAESAVIKANPVLIEVLISNLISNAIRHTAKSGIVILEGTRDHIVVANAGVPLEHPEKMFQRFHRESRTTFGSGLGLSIVKKVCDVAGYEIAYTYMSPMHKFKISF
jgi:signal transduction histidine kinase